MTPLFKGFLWVVFIICLFAGLKKVHADEIPPMTLFTQGDVSFCNKLSDARIVAKAKGTDVQDVVMQKMSDLKRCGRYTGPFLVMEKKEVVNGVGIYYASTVPFEGNPKGYVFMFSSEPKPKPMT